MDQIAKICCFCGREDLKLLYDDLYHPYKNDQGPYTFYKCRNCGSGLTIPIPKPSDLILLYNSFDGGMIPIIRELRDRYPLSKWYAQCIAHAMKNYSFSKNSVFAWMDIGAGNGELALQLTQKYPFSEGLAIDFHNEPDLLKKHAKINWERRDLNDNNVYPAVDIIMLITVLEHLMFPDIIIDALLNSLKPGGRMYITVPDFGSLANRTLKTKWPYFLPGEHLCIPTIKGMQLLLNRKCSEKFKKGFFEINVGKTKIPYPVGYYTQYFSGIRLPGFLANIPVPISTGILEASVTLKKST